MPVRRRIAKLRRAITSQDISFLVDGPGRRGVVDDSARHAWDVAGEALLAIYLGTAHPLSILEVLPPDQQLGGRWVAGYDLGGGPATLDAHDPPFPPPAHYPHGGLRPWGYWVFELGYDGFPAFPATQAGELERRGLLTDRDRARIAEGVECR